MELNGNTEDEGPKIEQLREANQQLQESLKACHELVARYRSKLAANANEPFLIKNGDQADDAAHS